MALDKMSNSRLQNGFKMAANASLPTMDIDGLINDFREEPLAAELIQRRGVGLKSGQTHVFLTLLKCFHFETYSPVVLT